MHCTPDILTEPVSMRIHPTQLPLMQRVNNPCKQDKLHWGKVSAKWLVGRRGWGPHGGPNNIQLSASLSYNKKTTSENTKVRLTVVMFDTVILYDQIVQNNSIKIPAIGSTPANSCSHFLNYQQNPALSNPHSLHSSLWN